VNYVLKRSSCCGEKDDTEDSGCCKDEGLVLQSTTDFTLKETGKFDFVKTVCELHYISLPFLVNFLFEETTPLITSDYVPPDLRTIEIISNTVLRI
jgi:hypothetical protein